MNESPKKIEITTANVASYIIYSFWNLYNVYIIGKSLNNLSAQQISNPSSLILPQKRQVIKKNEKIIEPPL